MPRSRSRCISRPDAGSGRAWWRSMPAVVGGIGTDQPEQLITVALDHPWSPGRRRGARPRCGCRRWCGARLRCRWRRSRRPPPGPRCRAGCPRGRRTSPAAQSARRSSRKRAVSSGVTARAGLVEHGGAAGIGLDHDEADARPGGDGGVAVDDAVGQRSSRAGPHRRGRRGTRRRAGLAPSRTTARATLKPLPPGTTGPHWRG